MLAMHFYCHLYDDIMIHEPFHQLIRTKNHLDPEAVNILEWFIVIHINYHTFQIVIFEVDCK